MLNGTIVNRVNITNDLVVLKIKPDSGVPDFLPGQYVALALYDDGEVKEGSKGPKLIKRAYSIGSAPHQKDYLEFYIAIVKDGALTPRVDRLMEGDRIFVAPKITGTFVLSEVTHGKNLIFVSTGTGIAPYMAMLRTPGTLVPERKITIVHGVRYPSDLAYAEELRGLALEHPGFSYLPIVSRPDDSWTGDKGYVQRFFKEGIISLNPAIDHIFLCGNPAMIEEMEAFLGSLGYTEHTRKSPGNLHLEKYW